MPRGDEGIAPYACWVDTVEGIGAMAGASPHPTMWQEGSGSVGVDARCCGAQNLLLAYAHQILTAATPCCSLHPPPAALATVPSTRVRTFVIHRRGGNLPPAYALIPTTTPPKKRAAPQSLPCKGGARRAEGCYWHSRISKLPLSSYYGQPPCLILRCDCHRQSGMEIASLSPSKGGLGAVHHRWCHGRQIAAPTNSIEHRA